MKKWSKLQVAAMAAGAAMVLGHHCGYGSNAGENGSGHKGGFRGAGGTEGILVGQ